MAEDKDHKKKSNQLNSYAKYSGIAIQMIIIIGIGAFAGVKLDEKFPNNHNLFTLVLSLTSVIVSVLFVIRQIIAASKDDK